MVTTLTAVPYLAASTTRVIQHHQNPALRAGLAGWDDYAGTGGTDAALTREVYSARLVARDGAVLPSQFVAHHVQIAASTSPGGVLVRTPTGSVGSGAIHASMYVAASTPIDMRLTLVWVNAAGSPIGSSPSGPVVTVDRPATGFARLSVVGGSAPAGTDRVEVWAFTVGPVPAGLVIDATAVLIANSSSQLPYFDGSSRVPVGGYASWRGAPDASYSDWFRRTPAASSPHVVLAAPAHLVLDVSEQRESATVLHHVIGRPDPVPALGPLRARTGVLDVWCEDYETARAVVDLYELGGVVMLRDDEDPRRDMYHVVTAVPTVVEGDERRRWRVPVGYAETYATGDLW